MVYIVFFILIFSPYISTRSRIRSSLGESDLSSIVEPKKRLSRRYYKQYFLLVSLLMIGLLALRHDYVGTDTKNYRLLYDMFRNMSFKEALLHINDVSFVFVFRFLARLGLNFRAVLLLQAILYIGSVTIFIKRYSEIPALSYWIFMTFGFFVFATTMRQAIATAIILLSYRYIKEKRMLLFIGLVLLAATFHVTAIIFLPVYWIEKFKFNRKTIFLIVFITILLSVFSKKISLLFLSYSKIEYIPTQTGGYFLALYFFILLCIGFIYKRNFIMNNYENKMFFYMMAATLALIPISKINPAMFRITNYYQIFTIVYIPNLIASIRDKGMKLLLTYGFIILGLIYFYYKIGSYGINMHPYIPFWREYTF